MSAHQKVARERGEGYTISVDMDGVTVTTDAGARFEVDPGDLTAGDWMYDDGHIHSDDECPPCELEHVSDLADITEGGVVRVIHDWHNANHAGPFKFCYEDPCKPLRDTLEDLG